jgi:hypothetical protein
MPHDQPAPAPPGMIRTKHAAIGAGVAFLIGLGFGGAAMATDSSTGQPSARATVTVTASPKRAKAAAPASSTSPTRRAKVTMPNVVGKNGAAAEARLKALGFKEITFGSADQSARVVLLPQNWEVTKQDPKPGAKISPDAAVVLTAVKLS